MRMQMLRNMVVVGASALALASVTVALPSVADAAARHGGGGGRGHMVVHAGGYFRGGGGHGGYVGGGYGGGYYAVCGPIQLTLGLCGPWGY